MGWTLSIKRRLRTAIWAVGRLKWLRPRLFGCRRNCHSWVGLWNTHVDEDGRPYGFRCHWCNWQGQYKVVDIGYNAHVEVEAVERYHPFRLGTHHPDPLHKAMTPTTVAAALFRARGYDWTTASLLSLPYWTRMNRKKMEQVTGKKLFPEPGSGENAEYVAGVIRNEERAALRLMDQMEEHGPAELSKRGVSPDTVGRLHATRGWDAEMLCGVCIGEDYYREHKKRIVEAIAKHSGKN